MEEIDIRVESIMIELNKESSKLKDELQMIRNDILRYGIEISLGLIICILKFNHIY